MPKRDLTTIGALSQTEIASLLQRARFYKGEGARRSGVLSGKIIGLFFEKPSTRTRVSFEAAIMQMGGQTIFLSAQDTQVGRGETIADTARVLSGYLDGLVIRTFGHSKLEEWCQHATIPIINGLTDLHHPCQVLSDLFTIAEKKEKLKGLKMTYLGDGGNNMAHSLMEGGTKMGMDVTVACPDGYAPNATILRDTLGFARDSGGSVRVITDSMEGAMDADVLYTDVWFSMGYKMIGDPKGLPEAKSKFISHSHKKVLEHIFKAYQINSTLLEKAKPNVMILHCMPIHRGEEIAGEVVEDIRSVIFEQAKNRLYAQKAILEYLFGG